MNRHDKTLTTVLWASLCMGSIVLLGSPRASANDALTLHPHTAVLAAATDLVQRRAPRALIEAQNLDPRVQLRHCEAPLQAEMPVGVALTARINVRVRCTAPAAWSVLVPVSVSSETSVWVAQVALRAGEPIREQHLRRETRRFPGTDDCCIRDLTEVLGRVSRRPLSAGAILQRADIETADLIKRGEIVTIIAGNPSLEVRASGVALGNAKLGEAVRIRHSESLRIIQARADSEGVVRVP